MEWAAGMDLEGQGAGSCKVSSGRNDWMGCFAANSQQAGDQEEDCEKNVKRDFLSRFLLNLFPISCFENGVAGQAKDSVF